MSLLASSLAPFSTLIGLINSEMMAARVDKIEKTTIGIGSLIVAMKGVQIEKRMEKKWVTPNPVAMKLVGNTSASEHS